MKRFVISLVALVVCCLPISAQPTKRQLMKKLNYVYNLIDDHYVEDMPLEPMVEEAIRATLHTLDPHSRYLTKEEMEASNRQLKGKFAGIGISNFIHNDTLVVRTTFDGSPAQRAGILPNDRIIAIDGKSIIGHSQDSIAMLMAGDVGSPIALSIVRGSKRESITIELRRDNIRIGAVSAFRIDSVGYVTISSFTKNLASEFYQAYTNLGQVKSLVLDLRNNGGGYLTAAIDLSSLFLTTGDVVVITESRRRTNTYSAKRDGILKDMPLVVVINENTASASEIFAGAMQDHDRAIIVGQTSYGKGLVQKNIEYKDGSGLRITTARYKTPSGRPIQRPYIKGESEAYLADSTRYIHPDSIYHDTALMFKTLKLGREVYAGGGITPDVYIASEGSSLSDIVGRSIDSSAVEHSIVDFWDMGTMDSVRMLYPTKYEFRDGYTVAPALWQIIGKRAGYTYDDIADHERRFVETYILSSIAERLYGTEARDYIYISMFDYMAEQAIAIAKSKQ